MSRMLPTENILSTELPKKNKIRNYSFQKSKRLPIDKMTEINGIKIPSMPGSCYHAIIATLAEYKDKFCSWNKIIELTHRNIRMYGGQKALDKFISKNDVKSYQQRIKDNTHTLTRTGRDCYGYRLHEQGMCIYYFKDGAMLVTGGALTRKGDSYDVLFEDGKTLQSRYRGTTMTYKEYKRFLDKGYIDISGKILNSKGIKNLRSSDNHGELSSNTDNSQVHVCVVLRENANQHTAERFQRIGLKVDEALENELLGTISNSLIDDLRNDIDVQTVEVSGE